MRNPENYLKFSVDKVLNGKVTENEFEEEFESIKELNGVEAVIDLYRSFGDDTVSVFIVDAVCSDWHKMFDGKEAIENAINYANQILKNEVAYI